MAIILIFRCGIDGILVLCIVFKVPLQDVLQRTKDPHESLPSDVNAVCSPDCIDAGPHTPQFLSEYREFSAPPTACVALGDERPGQHTLHLFWSMLHESHVSMVVHNARRAHSLNVTQSLRRVRAPCAPHSGRGRVRAPRQKYRACACERRKPPSRCHPSVLAIVHAVHRPKVERALTSVASNGAS